MTSLWTRCNSCQRILYKQDILDNQYVCPSCKFHFRISSLERLGILYDEGKYERFDEHIRPVDALRFVDSRPYADRLEENRRKTRLEEAVINSKGTIDGLEVIVCAMDFSFMGGSMGSVVGEKVTRAIERATAERLPLIVISCSGGARMQEGALSLMQMAKTSAALARLDEARLPFISVMTDPTTGGTTASYSMLGDLNIAEPNALVGFAGPRVIEQTIREKLPKGFQRAEFLLAHGMLDDVLICSGEKENLLQVRAVSSSVVTAFTYCQDRGGASSKPYLAAAVRVTLAAVRETLPWRICRMIDDARADGTMLYHKLATPAVVRAAHRRGLLVGVWTVDSLDDIVRLRRMGVDSITSNRPDLLDAERMRA